MQNCVHYENDEMLFSALKKIYERILFFSSIFFAKVFNMASSSKSDFVEETPEKIRHVQWTSSHGQPYHPYQNEMREILSHQTRYVQTPIFNAGRSKIRQSLVDEILEDVHAWSGQPQVHVIIVGANNLREGQEAPEVVQHFTRLLKATSTVKRCFVIVVSFIPDCISDQACKARFIEASKYLRKACNKFKGTCSLVNSQKIFLSHGELIKDMYVNDGVHLSVAGSKALAKVIGKTLSYVPQSVFQ